jgi:hypothetical protein
MNRAIEMPEQFKDEKPDAKRQERFSRVVAGLMAVSKLEALKDEKRELESAIGVLENAKRKKKRKAEPGS